MAVVAPPLSRHLTSRQPLQGSCDAGHAVAVLPEGVIPELCPITRCRRPITWRDLSPRDPASRTVREDSRR